MILAIVGTGNSGSALVMRIAETVTNCTVRVASHRRESAQAAVLDAASAFPDRAAQFDVCGLEDIGEADVIAICAGLQIGKGQTAADLLIANALLVKSLLSEIKPKCSAVVILIATPVDDITVVAQAACRLPPEQVIGFGGDLDTSRLQYSLLRRGISSEAVCVVGEHGGRAIPGLR